MNICIISGNLVRDPELTKTSNGLSKLQFSLAVSRPYTKDGEKETDFLTIIAWRTLAENCYKYLKKGSKCTVVGSVQTRTYEARDGIKKYVTEILADKIEFNSSKPTNNEEPKKEPVAEQIDAFEPIFDEQLPF